MQNFSTHSKMRIFENVFNWNSSIEILHEFLLDILRRFYIIILDIFNMVVAWNILNFHDMIQQFQIRIICILFENRVCKILGKHISVHYLYETTDPKRDKNSEPSKRNWKFSINESRYFKYKYWIYNINTMHQFEARLISRPIVSRKFKFNQNKFL